MKIMFRHSCWGAATSRSLPSVTDLMFVGTVAVILPDVIDCNQRSRKRKKIIHQRVYYDWLDKQANNGEEFRWGNFSFQLARRDRKANSRAHTQIHRWFMAYCTIFSCRKAKQWWMIMYIRRVSHQYLVNIFSLAKVTIWQKVFVNDGSGWLSRTQRSRAVGHRVLFSRTRRFGICSFHQRND